MNKIKINNVEFEVEGYNKNTYFNGGTVTSNGNMTIKVSDMTTLNELAEDTIDTIQIYHDSELVYNLQDADAKIDSINEYFNGERMNVSVNFIFAQPQVEEPNT